MVLEMDSWAVSGAQSSARIARLQLQSGTASGNGIVGVDDMVVLPLQVPGTSVRITSGGATVLGQEMGFQGSYFAFNVGDATLPISPTGSGGGRSDLVVLRVEDPTISGTSWGHNPASDPVYYFRVLEGVDPTTTEPPPGTTAIALARIDIPASTATITQDMIVDVRQIANPRSHLVKRVQRGVSPIDYAGNIVDPSFENWPNVVWTDVAVPWWATQVQIDAVWGQAGFFPADYSGSGSTDARGQVRVSLGVTGNVVRSGWSSYNFNQVSATNGVRVAIFNFDQVLVPESLRGITTNLQMQVSGDPLAGGRLRADSASNFRVDLLFQQRPVEDVT